MKRLWLLTLVGLIGLVPVIQLQAAAAGGGGKPQNPADQVPTTLSSVPLPELPAQAADLVSNTKQKDQESVALAVVQWTASAHPGSIDAVVGALAAVLPSDAADLALAAAKLVPSAASAIDSAAIHGAPTFTSQINRALAPFLPPPQSVNNPNSEGDNGNRPNTPPGWTQGKGNKEGSIHGDRPSNPPGHEPEPDHDRDDHRRHYGSP